ncbi:hypothetical protein ACHAWC_003094 [Mediolabrus comicus]
MTTSTSPIGEELKLVKASILPALFEGLEVKKVSSTGKLANRVLTISDDLFKLCLSRTGKRRLRGGGKKAVSKVVGTLMATEVDHTQFNVRVIDVADILFVHTGFGSRKIEAASAIAFRGERLDPKTVVSIFHRNMQTTDLILEDDDDRKALISSIQLIIDVYRSSSKPREELLLRYVWDDVDWDGSGFLDSNAFFRLLCRINIYIKKEKVMKLYRDYCAKICPEQERHSLGQRLRGSKLRLMGSKRHLNNSGLSFDECIGLLQRVKAEQNATLGWKRDCTEIIRAFGGSADGESIDRNSFEEYLFSVENNLFDPAKERFDESILNKSLSEYWINSSHNTYLTGDQVQSASSLETYTIALQRGCKCLELDCFDSAAGVVVYHIYTATTEILFSDIIVTVKNYIISNPTTLPIILSLDNHCSLPYQEMQAHILKAEFGDMLYYPSSTCDKLPTPKDLVGKVILKGRRMTGRDDGLSETTRTSLQSKRMSVETLIGRRVSLPSRLSISRPKGVARNASEDAADETSKISPELAEITTFNTVKYADFPSLATLPVTNMLSMSETKVLKILDKNDQINLWKDYNSTHMTRVYPSGGRLDSSNFNPVVHWAVSCQMVALNYQTDDTAMTINDGRFRENFGCGYVLKSLGDFPGKLKLKIKVLAGSCLPKPYGEGEVISPYVMIRLHDIIEHRLKLDERKTNAVQDNGYCPQWAGGKEFSFQVDSPGVAMLQFTVLNSDEGFIDDIICRTAIPVRCLREGVRSVHFYDRNSQWGTLSLARLLVQVKIEDHIP